MNVAPTELPLVKAELQSGGYPLDDLPRCVEMLTQRAQVPNPVPQGAVPAPIDVKVAMGKVITAELKQIDNDTLDRFAAAADAGDMVKVWRIFEALVAKAILVASKQALQDYLARTILDPSWQATVEGPSVIDNVLGRRVGALSIEDLQEALA